MTKEGLEKKQKKKEKKKKKEEIFPHKSRASQGCKNEGPIQTRDSPIRENPACHGEVIGSCGKVTSFSALSRWKKRRRNNTERAEMK